MSASSDAREMAVRMRAGIHALRTAAVAAAGVQDAALSAGGRLAKSDASPVTIADYAVQAIVSLLLQAREPEAAPGACFQMLAEEDAATLRGATSQPALLEGITDAVNVAMGSVASAEGRHWTRMSLDAVCAAIDAGHVSHAAAMTPAVAEAGYWILDPIDGTKGFLRRAHYAIGLAFVRRGVPQLGLMACPTLAFPGQEGGSLLVAVAGGGAHALPLQATAEAPSDAADPLDAAVPLRGVTSAVEMPDAVLAESFERSHSAHDVSAILMSQLGITAPPIRADSMAKYGMLARGEAHIFMRRPQAGYVEKVWDHAPGVLLIQEAGGVVTDIAGVPLDFSRGAVLQNNEGVVATLGVSHARVLAALQSATATASAAAAAAAAASSV